MQKRENREQKKNLKLEYKEEVTRQKNMVVGQILHQKVINL